VRHKSPSQPKQGSVESSINQLVHFISSTTKYSLNPSISLSTQLILQMPGINYSWLPQQVNNVLYLKAAVTSFANSVSSDYSLIVPVPYCIDVYVNNSGNITSG
jgi:hypothetical protein